MTRQEIIKAIEICYEVGHACTECPLFSEDECNCNDKLMHDVLALLKEQEEVTPYIDIDEAKCTVCKVKLTRQELIGDNVLFEDFFDYCPHCGKKVKWEGSGDY